MFCVYIIFSSKLNRYYVGTTDDFVKRLAEHNDLKHPGSFTSRGIPWGFHLLIVDLHCEQAYQIQEHSDLVIEGFLPTFTQQFFFPNEKVPHNPFCFIPTSITFHFSGN